MTKKQKRSAGDTAPLNRDMERYHAMLAGRGLKVGDQVVCEYRCPTPHQWWIHPWHVGVIETVATEATPSRSSEAYYCATYQYVRVRYLGGIGSHGFTQTDSLGSLLPLTGDQVSESPFFGSSDSEAIRLYEFACRAGLGAKYAEESQKAWHNLNREAR